MSRVWKRQANGAAFGDEGEEYDDDYNGYHSWWWTPAGTAVRYAIFAVFIGSIMLFLVGGYYSTQRRLRRGLPPRPAFRWMVRRRGVYHYPSQHPHAQHQQQHYHAHYADPNSQGYGMYGYPAPPPPYQSGDAPPPVYQPPPGASKAMPDQRVQGVGGTEGEASSSASLERPPPAARP